MSVCLTVDIWSSRQMRGFLGITGHYIVDWTLKYVMLACKRFRGRHTAENIRIEYDETIACFDFAKKVCNILTDNASYMIKAFKLPGYDEQQEEEFHLSEMDSDDSDFEGFQSEPEDDTIIHQLPEHNPCFAHALQLVVKDGLKDAQQITKVLGKASNIVSHVRRSAHATDLLDGEKKLQAANATHWNSQVKMVRSILNMPADKLSTLPTQWQHSN